MVKKLLTLACGLAIAFGAMADNYPYPESNIQFWTGSGSNTAVVVISWDDEDATYAPQGFAWGVRFNGSITAHNLLDTIAAYDSRFTFTFSSVLLSTIEYHDNANNVHLTPSIQYNCFNINGTFAPDVYDNIYISDDDMMEVSESCYFDCTNVSPATDPNGPTDPQPEEATIAAGDIVYWVGQGSNEVVLAVNWADTALAWGYRFGTDSVSVQQVMDDIAEADPRFSWEAGAWGLGDILFALGEGDTLRGVPGSYWESKLNGFTDMGMGQMLGNGDFEKWAEPAAGVITDSSNWGGAWYYSFTYPMTIHAVSVPEATFAASDILYWVGQGSNEVVLAVNWADTALAWGYRFGTDSVSVQQVMDDIAEADPRFSWEAGAWGLGDILFALGEGDTLRGVPGSYWESKLNGFTDMGMGQMLGNGDFEKWAEPAAGVITDSSNLGGVWYYTFTYPMTIHAVSVPGNESIATAASATVSVYPNPATKAISVKAEGIEASTAELYDMTGRRVAAQALTDGQATLSVDGIAAGVYMLRMGNATAKIIVRH